MNLSLTPEESATELATKQYLHWRENKDKPLKSRPWFNPHSDYKTNDPQMTDEFLNSLFSEKYKAAMEKKEMELRGVQTHTGAQTISIEERELRQESLLDGVR